MASLEDIKHLIDSSNEKIISNINQEITNCYNALSKKIADIHCKFEADITEIKQDTAALHSKINMLEDKFTRLERRNLLVIRNIPMHPETENVHNLFELIAKIIGYEVNPASIPSIHRLPAENKQIVPVETKVTRQRIRQNNLPTTTTSYFVVFVNFHTLNDRRKFLHLYFKHGNLNLSIIPAINMNTRIYIGDYLTKTNYNILRAATKLKKGEKITKIRIVDGLVYIMKTPNGKSFLIASMEDLERLKL